MKTLKERVNAALNTAKGEMKASSMETWTLLTRPSYELRPCGYSGNRYTPVGYHKIDKAAENLTAIGIDFEIGNDAPRGGYSGNFLRITKKGHRQLAKFRAELKAERLVEQARIEAEKQAIKEAAQKLLDELPENKAFEILWDSKEQKDASGISWRQYREQLKSEHPEKWEILKAKFKLQQKC